MTIHNNSELIKAGRDFRDMMTSATALIDIAKMISNLASQLDVTTAALREKTKQCDALVIPTGWKLIPEELHLGEDEIELICSQCGNGDELYGDFVDGVFRVGEIEDDEGKMIYGLHVTCADYPEEGGVTIAVFTDPIHEESDHA